MAIFNFLPGRFQRGISWGIIGESIQGASHKRRNIPNQDAISWWPDTLGRTGVLSVSDGHGSPKYFRSSVGAQIAVEISVDVLKNLLEVNKEGKASAIKRIVGEQLAQTLTRKWAIAVQDHLKDNPITPEEIDSLESKSPGAFSSVEKNQLIAYGATLLAAAITNKYAIFAQIGDGDIVVVSDEGEVFRPVAPDPTLFANETTSLCLKDSWRECRVHFQAFQTSYPALVLMSTDGYANSFKDERDFLKVGSDLHEIIRTEGIESIKTSIKEWLEEASMAGSGDDISLGIIYRTDIAKR